MSASPTKRGGTRSSTSGRLTENVFSSLDIPCQPSSSSFSSSSQPSTSSTSFSAPAASSTTGRLDRVTESSRTRKGRKAKQTPLAGMPTSSLTTTATRRPVNGTATRGAIAAAVRGLPSQNPSRRPDEDFVTVAATTTPTTSNGTKGDYFNLDELRRKPFDEIRTTVPLPPQTAESAKAKGKKRAVDANAETEGRLFGLEHCPVYRPTIAEWAKPMEYIERISPEAKQYGIAKIVPPEGWKPPFVMNPDAFKFKTRVQRLNSMEASSRATLNFLEQLYQFHKQNGTTGRVSVPNVGHRALDLWRLRKEVALHGGYVGVTDGRKWSYIATVLGYDTRLSPAVSGQIKNAYVKIILPFEEYTARLSAAAAASTGGTPKKDQGGGAGATGSGRKRLARTASAGSPVVGRMGKMGTGQVTPGGGVGAVGMEREVTIEKVMEASAKLNEALNPDGADTPASGSTSWADESVVPRKGDNCEICQLDHDPLTILLCDGCDGGFHLSCLEPPLAAVPSSDNWFCDACLLATGDDYGFDEGHEHTLTSFKKRSNAFKEIWLDKHPPPHWKKEAVTPPPPREPVMEIKPTVMTFEANPPTVVAPTPLYDIKPNAPFPSVLTPPSAIPPTSAVAAGPSAIPSHLSISSPPLSNPFQWSGSFPVPDEPAPASTDMAPSRSMISETSSLSSVASPRTDLPVRQPTPPPPRPPRIFPPEDPAERILLEDWVEREFWRLVESQTEVVEVEYGADLHSSKFGSGLPSFESHPLEPYTRDGWNLNNFPILPGSLLRYIRSDISGMTNPWIYVGMVFSTFAWHKEDHYTYSVNYQHWGDTKTWYGVPASDDVKLDAAMKVAAPELFEQQPDLLFQLVTLMSPGRLKKAGVKVYACDQRENEFVVTFPRAYHAGFNHGFNFNEAVNFALPDWLPQGLECVKRYRELKKPPVFSHDELAITIFHTDKSPKMSLWLHQSFSEMVDRELADRASFKTRYPYATIAVDPTDQPEAQYSCNVCRSFCFLSQITSHASIGMGPVACPRHAPEMTTMQMGLPDRIMLRCRYSDEELAEMKERLRGRSEKALKSGITIPLPDDVAVDPAVAEEQLRQALLGGEKEKGGRGRKRKRKSNFYVDDGSDEEYAKKPRQSSRATARSSAADKGTPTVSRSSTPARPSRSASHATPVPAAAVLQSSPHGPSPLSTSARTTRPTSENARPSAPKTYLASRASAAVDFLQLEKAGVEAPSQQLPKAESAPVAESASRSSSMELDLDDIDGENMSLDGIESLYTSGSQPAFPTIRTPTVPPMPPFLHAADKHVGSASDGRNVNVPRSVLV